MATTISSPSFQSFVNSIELLDIKRLGLMGPDSNGVYTETLEQRRVLGNGLPSGTLGQIFADGDASNTFNGAVAGIFAAWCTAYWQKKNKVFPPNGTYTASQNNIPIVIWSDGSDYLIAAPNVSTKQTIGKTTVDPAQIMFITKDGYNNIGNGIPDPLAQLGFALGLKILTVAFTTALTAGLADVVGVAGAGAGTIDIGASVDNTIGETTGITQVINTVTTGADVASNLTSTLTGGNNMSNILSDIGNDINTGLSDIGAGLSTLTGGGSTTNAPVAVAIPTTATTTTTTTSTSLLTWVGIGVGALGLLLAALRR